MKTHRLAVAIVLAAGFGLAQAAPVTYSFSTGTVPFGGPSTPGGPAPALSLFNGGVSGTFVYDSAALQSGTNADGSFSYRGFTPSSVTGFSTSLSNLSGSVGGHAFTDASGSTQVGNDTFGTTTPVDVFQFLFDPSLASTARHNFSTFEVEGGFTVNAIRMFWIEGQATPGLIADFLTNQNLLASPPTFTGRLSLDITQTGNPAATSFVLFDGLTVQPVTAAIPEPETYALMLAGLGLLGFAALRRKSA